MNNKIIKASLVNENQITETVYDPIKKKTDFAVYENGKVEYLNSVKIDGEDIYPLNGKSDLLSKGVVLLPSEATDYESEEILISEIKIFIHKYLDISPMFEEIASYYVPFSWIYDRFHELPYLRAIGDYGSGKTRFLQVIGSICYKPIFTGGATTTAPIFRILDEIKGTLILDEADLRFSDMTTDLIKILNMGYQKGGSVLRMKHKDSSDIRAFDVFSPKVIATRQTFDDKALESRFLIEEMGRGKLRSDVPRRLTDEFWEEAREIRNKLLMWRFRNYHKELIFDDCPIEGIHPRLHQIIIPLLAVIESKEIKESLKDFIQKYNDELVADRGLSWESDIIFAVLKLSKNEGVLELTMKEIAQFVNREGDIEENTLTPKKVGWILRAKLQLKPYKTRKGYVLNLKKNIEKLVFLKDRFGILDSDLMDEDVNVANNVNKVEEAVSENLWN